MNRLRKVREQKGLPLKAVAYDIGISMNTLSQYETGKREPKLETWIKLADYYEMSFSSLIGQCMSFDELQKAIIKWAIDRNIINSKNIGRQFMKVTEELGELAEGINKDNQGQIKDSLGDILVTLIILSKDLDVDLLDCLRGAYDVIKDRTGKTVNGVFVKEEDLHD